MSDEVRPANEHEKADAMFVSILDILKKFYTKKGLAPDSRELQVAMQGALFALHTQAIALQQRPDMTEPYLQMMEGFLIETKMTKKDAEGARRYANESVARIWARLDAMVADVADDKPNA